MVEDILNINKINEVELHLQCNISQRLELKEFTSFYAEGYKFHPAYRAHIWNGKVSYYDIKNSTFPIGLLPELLKFCDRYQYKPKFNFDVNSLIPKNISDESLKLFYNELFKDSKYYPRDYQHDAIKSALNNARGIIQSPTGSGKSLIIYTIIRYMIANSKKVILVVPNVSLVNQMYSDFVDYGWYKAFNHVEKLYSGQKPTFGKDVLITTFQSLMNKPKNFFDIYSCIINDEAHSVKSVELQKISKKCSNANFRLGFTGTMPKNDADKYNIQGALGPVIFKYKTKELVDEGVLSKIKIANCFIQYPDEISELGRRRNYNDEINLIEETVERNKAFDFVFNNIPDGQNTIILVNHRKHLDSIADYIESNIDDKYTLYIIHGSIKPEDRENIRKTIDNSSNVILLATYQTVSTGVNIKRIHNVILGSSSKSEIRVLQTIGRGLRKHAQKDGVIIWDFIDDFSYENRNGNITKNHVYNHWEQRYKYYIEQEFPCFKKIIKV